MTSKVITLLAEKGGVGRTTLALNLAGAFALTGRRVLLVDFEGQSSLSKLCLGPTVVDQLPIHKMMASIFEENAIAIASNILVPTPFHNVTLAPSSRILADYDYPRAFTMGVAPYALRDFLSELQDSFDLVIIDTPPKIQGLLGVAAVIAADAVITPVEPEPFAVQSVVEVHRLLLEVQQTANSNLRHLGFVVTKKSRQSLHKATEAMLRNNYQSQVFATVIREAAPYADANAFRVPITHYEPKSKAKATQKGTAEAQAEVKELAIEIEQRLAGKIREVKVQKTKGKRAA